MNTKIQHIEATLWYKKLGLFAFAAFFVLVMGHTADAATLYLSPASGSYPVGSTITVSVRTNTQNQAVNTAEASITFSSDTLELTKVSAGSTFYLPAPGSPSKTKSSAYFGGGLPTPGYTGAGGTVGTLTFRALREGAASISITSGKVLLNDGAGTNALAGSSGARFTIIPPSIGSPIVSSGSHPDPNAWYATTTLELTWSRPANAYGFSFELDQTENTTPDNTLDTTVTAVKAYPELKEGVYFFHIKARRQEAVAPFGATAHFRAQIDTTSPDPFSISLVGQADPIDVTRTPSISFDTKDALSGIDHYDVLVDDVLLQAAATAPYAFSKLERGPHIIAVVAYDKAGNTQRSALPLVISGPQGPLPFQVDEYTREIIAVPFQTMITINIIILLIVIFIAWLLFHHHRKQQPEESDEIRQLQAEIDSELNKLKQNIDKKLVKLLTEKSTRDIYDRGTGTLKDIHRGVNDTRQTINSDIERIVTRLKRIRSSQSGLGGKKKT